MIAEYEGVRREGIVTDLNHEDKEACVETDIQKYWYSLDRLFPIPLDEGHLISRLGFEKQDVGDQIKYMKGAFRIQAPKGGDFSQFEMWYREDRRHINYHMAVHGLQNAYRQMTKVDLVPEIA